MTKEGTTKIQEYKSRHTLYLKKEIVKDSTFPFDSGEELKVRIEGEKLVIKKAAKKEKGGNI